MCEMTRSCSAPIDPAAIHSVPVALGQKDVSQTLTRQNSLAGRGVWTLLFVSVLTGVGLAEGLGRNQTYCRHRSQIHGDHDVRSDGVRANDGG